MIESRTTKSIKNAKVTLIYYFLQLILGFFSRKAFFDYLGSEVLGLNTTASNLLNFLNLAELGVGMAVGYFLYQPLFDQDHDKINKIVSLQGWIYRKIACFIIVASLVLMGFFPWIFAKSPLPLWYAYSTFSVLLFSALIGYFVNYRQILLNADQKNYKVQKIIQGFAILKTIIQIVGITHLPHPFTFWLSIEVVFSILSAFILDLVLKKEYPWLHTQVKEGKKFLKEYPDVLTKTKQVFFHKLSYVILSQSSPLILYGFTSLSAVALYGNYLLITAKLSTLINSMFNSTTAGIGDLVASKDKVRIMKVFWELYDSRLCITTIVLLCLFFLTQPFITIWLGSEYLLSTKFLILLLCLTGISFLTSTIESYKIAYGLFQDIWAPAVEAVLNISLSILLGYYFNIEGIIAGILLSQLFLLVLWKPYFLFKEGFLMKPIIYFKALGVRLIILLLIIFICRYVFSFLPLAYIDSYWDWMLYGSVVLGFVAIITCVTFYIFSNGMRDFVGRLNRIIQTRWFK